MAQRKFLRQLSSFTSQLDPYPRLFVADLVSNPEEEGEEEPSDKIVIDDLQAGKFCIRLLCEYEKVGRLGQIKYEKEKVIKSRLNTMKSWLNKADCI